MSLRVKTLLIVGLGLTLLVGALAAASRSAILDGFGRVETDGVRDALGRVRDALALDATTLKNTTIDYAQWDDTYEFAGTNADAYIEANLNADTFERMRIGACVVVRTDGTVLRRIGYDFVAGAPRVLPDALVVSLARDQELARRVRRQRGVVGLVAAGTAGLWLVAAQPILRSDSSGPARGTLFLGRPVDRAEVARLSETNHQSLKITLLPAERQTAGSGADALVRALSAHRIAGYASLHDLHDRPVAVLRTVLRRPVLEHGRAVWSLVLFALVAVAVFASATILLLLERTVVVRLREIVGATRHVADTGDLSTRIRIHSGDELAEVAHTLNGMLADLERTQAELRDKEQRWRGLVELLPDAVLVHAAGTVLIANAAARRMLGVTTDVELLGQPVATFVQRGSGEAGLPEREDHGALARLVGVDGRTTEVEVRQVPFAAMGQPAVQLVAHDVTERRRLESQLRQTQKMEALGRLAGGVAHDFNNLVMIISAHSEMLLEDLPDGDAKESVGEIKKAGARAASLTRQLLAFSRKQVLQPAILDLNVVLADVDRMLRRLIGEDVELVTERGDDLWGVKADAGQLEQVLMNLVVNAREAMPRGGRVRITTSTERVTQEADGVARGDWVKLTVADTGCGMDEATKARIFEPFFTTKAQGTGLGLATVFGIVQQSRGRIRLRSKVGEGTTFEILFPRADGVEAIPLTPELGQAGGNERILVVEDEAALRRVVCEVLRRAGYTVLEARDGREAMDLWRSRGHEIDLVLSDVVMPHVGGPDLKRWIDAQRPMTRTIFMSGYTNSETFDEVLEDTGAEFLQKPFTPDELARRVREVLDRPADLPN